jgi:hypothetical protein
VAVVINELTLLFQNELRLLRAEADERIKRITSSGGLIAGGAVAALAAVFLLLQSLVLWLAVAGLPEQWGYLAVGIIVAAIAVILVSSGISRLKETSLAPDRTIRQAREDLAAVKEHLT